MICPPEPLLGALERGETGVNSEGLERTLSPGCGDGGGSGLSQIHLDSIYCATIQPGEFKPSVLCCTVTRMKSCLSLNQISVLSIKQDYSLNKTSGVIPVNSHHYAMNS